ncbi:MULTISPECIES: TetR/AcrR family transcriptional regulator [unclassified Burkholderia]|uniref:TetR/AcrR family transcriptional regulator n=1 Tax=unclassified Burkholderia TaxID=2613784 RepID=UPI002AAF0CC2|nr:MULTISPECIES: TetR/AcrR family transcriptional regulator [unclassified Burkholderia]
MATKRKDSTVSSADANRARIRAAALDLFSTYGFEAVSTRQIATAVSMELGHLTYYYSSKEALWRELVAEKQAEFERNLDEAFSVASTKRTARSRAAIILPRLLEHLANERRLARLIMQEFSMQSPRHDWVVATCAEPIWIRMKPLFESLKDEGVLDGVSPATAYFSLVSAAVTLFAATEEIVRVSRFDIREPRNIDEAIVYLLKPLLGKGIEKARLAP